MINKVNSKGTYDNLEDIEIDEEVERIMNRFWIKMFAALSLDASGLLVLFLIFDFQFYTMFSYVVPFNPFDYIISYGYPLRAIFGTFLMFMLICVGHILRAIYNTIKYRTRPDKHLINVLKRYKMRVDESKFKKH
jgi:hypothetical protein